MGKISARALGVAEPKAAAGGLQDAKDRFAARVWNLTVSKGWTQAELGRRAGLGRDVINSYVNARSLPTVESAKKLAQAFGVTVNHLYPGAEEDFSATGSGITPFEMKTTTTGKMFVRLNMELPFEAAADIFAVLQRHGMTADT
jgi:transcriptional regulator with XRE-family HTH domain